MDWIVLLADKVPYWVLLALATLLGGAGGSLIAAARDVAMKVIDVASEEDPPPPNLIRPIEVLHDAQKMWERLESLRVECGADRVVLLRMTNGGKLPTVGKPLTSSIDLEALADGMEPLKYEWQDQLLDSYLTHTLVKMVDEGAVEMRAAEAQGISKGAMARAGNPVVHMFPVFTTEGTFYYLSVAFGTEPPALKSPIYRDHVRSVTGDLVKIFRRWHRGTTPL